jgi:methylisocitrate lyase
MSSAAPGSFGSPSVGSSPVGASSLGPSPAARLRSLIAQRGCVQMPGAFNGLCARAIASAGFEAAYVSGAATSVCAGVPDVGLLTLEHFCRVIGEVYGSSGLPLIADADTGFGEAEMVRRTVIEYRRAGAAGLHIEDQQFPKRCGHLDGKALVATDHMVEKVQWASRAAREVDLVVCSRTDARGVEGMDSALERARAYVDAGAEMIFPEGLASEAEFASFASALRRTHPGVLLLANMTEFGKTPMITLDRFKAAGYSVVIYPVSLLRVAMKGVSEALAHLKADGGFGGVVERMQTRQELYRLIDYTPGQPWETPIRR